MKVFFLGLLVALVPVAGAAEWRAPARPDPAAILSQAKQDAKAGHYREALDKHLWLFRQTQASFSPLRLSAGLPAWYQLGRKYPPALNALERVRAESGAQLMGTRADWRQFQDYSAITLYLDDDETATVHMFAWLDQHRPDLARKTYEIARPSLVAVGQHRFFDKYARPAVVPRIIPASQPLRTGGPRGSNTLGAGGG
jgi:hypothetical protein